MPVAIVMLVVSVSGVTSLCNFYAARIKYYELGKTQGPPPKKYYFSAKK
jgi:hypothetical protein